MKATKNGIKLGPDERRVGNFVFKQEKEYFKVMDINQTFTHRFSFRTTLGMMLAVAFQEGHDSFLRTFASSLYYYCSVIPDEKLFLDMAAACKACMERHPLVHGDRPQTEEGDAQAIEDVKADEKFMEDMQNAPDFPVKGVEDLEDNPDADAQ